MPAKKLTTTLSLLLLFGTYSTLYGRLGHNPNVSALYQLPSAPVTVGPGNAPISPQTIQQALESQSEGTANQSPEGESEMDDRTRTRARVEGGDGDELYSRIFGRNIFRQNNLTFEPSMNLATPDNYKLGPGDEVIIDIWGANQTSFRGKISPDGQVFISGLGPVYLNGMTVGEANKFLAKEFGKIYSSLEGEDTEINLTLGQIRTIQINIFGEVSVPGTYAVSSFATVFHALYRAGGVNPIGSMRHVYLYRNGRLNKELDIYDYILTGKSTDFVKLEEGDVIVVPPYDSYVEIEGFVKRPMIYEMKKGETVADLIKYSGGFTGEAYTRNINLFRSNGQERQIFTLSADDFGKFTLQDRDSIGVGTILDSYQNRLLISGAVFRPGYYQMTDQVNSILSLIKKAEGLQGDAFTNRVILTRTYLDYSRRVIPLDLGAILAGDLPDFELQSNDEIYIPSITSLYEKPGIRISGQVNFPGEYAYAENMTLEDLVIKAGGLLESASEVHIDVSRRIKEPKANEASRDLSRTYKFALKEGYITEGEPGFVLEPNDEVVVRKSPVYSPQRNVTISGEVVFEGTYTLSKKNERISDLVRKAGGLTTEAYLRGARIERRMNQTELAMLDKAFDLSARGGKDSVALETIDDSRRYPVAIDLPKALESPGSPYDMILREGDRLIIPEMVSTVKINGAVLHPNTVLFVPGMRVGYYINQSGGYSSNAKRSKAYVIYMNGSVSKIRRRSSNMFEPGCEIYVPSKRERERLSIGEVMSLATAASSVGTLGVAISNMAK